jgi:hypothetical protein
LTEGHVELVEAGVDLVELQRHRGVVGPEGGAVGEGRAGLVDRGDLDIAVAHDRGRDDDGLGILRELDLAVVVHLYDDVGAGRRHLVDVADRDAEHLDLTALVDRDGAREVSGQLVGVVATHHREPRRHDQREDGQGQDQPLGRAHLAAHPTPPPLARSGTGGRFWM